MSRHRVSTGLLIVMTAALWLGQSYGQRVGIGTANPEPRAILHLESDSMGFLPPRLTQQERDAIPTALRTPGLLIYNKTTNCMEFWNGSQWVGLCGGTAPCSSTPPSSITPTASPSPACEGQNITLSAPSFTNVNYIWIGPNNYFATGQNVVISSAQPSHSGTYCVKVYAGPCLFAEGCVNVTVNPAVVVEQKAPFPGSQRAGSSGFVIGDSLYVIQGGSVGNPCCSPVSGSYAYDVVNDAWRTITDPSTTRSIRAAFSLEGRGYIVGGHPYWVDECFRYNPATNSWTACANYPVGIADLNQGHAVGIGSYGYVLGGKNNNSGCFRNEIRRYDPSNDSWLTVGYLEGNSNSLGRSFMFVFEIGGLIYYGAGQRWDCASSQSFSSVWSFDPSTGATTPLGNAPFGGFVSQYCSLGGYGYVWAGGLWRYDPTSNTWSQVCINLPAPPNLMFAHGDKIYFINTSDSDPNLRRVYAWTP